MKIRVVFGRLCDVIGQYMPDAWKTTHKMCTVRKSEERKDLGNFLVVEDRSARELDLRADLCPRQTSNTDALRRDSCEHTK